MKRVKMNFRSKVRIRARMRSLKRVKKEVRYRARSKARRIARSPVKVRARSRVIRARRERIWSLKVQEKKLKKKGWSRNRRRK